MATRRKYEQAVPVDLPHQLKVKRLNSEQKWLWVVILLLSYQSPIKGKLFIDCDIPVTVDDLAWEASIAAEKVQGHLEVLKNLKMLSYQDGVFCIGLSEISDPDKKEIHDASPYLDSGVGPGAEEKSKIEVPPEELEIAEQMGYSLGEWIQLKAKNSESNIASIDEIK